MAHEEWSMSDFELDKYIDEGKFDKVYLAQEKKVDPPNPSIHFLQFLTCDYVVEVAILICKP